MAGGQSVNDSDSVCLAWRLSMLWCAHLDGGRVETCVELETRHKCVLRTVFSEFQS